MAKIYDCCGGKGSHMGGCPNAGGPGDGGKKKKRHLKSVPKPPSGMCGVTWEDTDDEHPSGFHFCGTSPHNRGQHMCVCGANN